MSPFRPVIKRDIIFALLGALTTYALSFVFNGGSSASISASSPLFNDVATNRGGSSTRIPSLLRLCPKMPRPLSAAHDSNHNQNAFSAPDPLSGPPTAMASLPHTSIVAHVPGWTLFRNLYMANGTLIIMSPSSANARGNFPQIRMMTSPGYPAKNTPEDIQRREPTKDHMDFITPEQADQRWEIRSSTDNDDSGGDVYRVWSIKGNTVLYNDPPQFLRHFYHFVAELLFGTWAFWFGAFTPSSSQTPLSLSLSSLRTADTPHNNPPYVPPIHRMIFAHSDVDGWHDNPGFDAYFFRAAFPSLAIEDQRMWQDRIQTTDPHSDDHASQRAWHFPLVLLADRSASFRGDVCGSATQRTASEAWQYMFERNQLLGVHAARWWDPLREAVWKFAGVDARSWTRQFVVQPKPKRSAAKEEILEVMLPRLPGGAFQYLLPAPETITITYISRQKAGCRSLSPEAHDELVLSIYHMVERRREKGDDWVFRVVEAEKLSKDEQVRIAARTTILLGVHGNGLTHLVLMPPTRLSTVIEIFNPGGFAHDYQWTANAMGMLHFSVWNDTYFSRPNITLGVYPPGFHSKEIPVHGPSVAKMIEDRVDGKIQ